MLEGKFIKSNSGRSYILNLPYEVEDDVRFVFDKNTLYAIDILQILVDGRTLSITDRGSLIEPQDYFFIHEVTEGQKEYFISMSWRKSGEDILRWTDTGGPDLTKVNQSLAYEISKEMKILDITYRIILPYPSLTINNLFDYVGGPGVII